MNKIWAHHRIEDISVVNIQSEMYMLSVGARIYPARYFLFAVLLMWYQLGIY
jgi:hypothetical protein